MAVCTFSQLNATVTPWSLPDPMMYLPSGETSTPCGDLPIGIRYTTPGTFFGSSTFTPPIMSALPSSVAFCAARQSTAAM